MKVLTFVSSLDFNSGGPSRSVPLLVKGLAELGVDIALMTIRSENMNIHALEGTTAKLKLFEPSFSRKEIRQYLIAAAANVKRIVRHCCMPYYIPIYS